MPFFFECVFFFFFFLFCVGTASGKCPDSKNFIFHGCLSRFLTLESLSLRLRLPILTFLSGTSECTRTFHGRKRGAPFYGAFAVLGDYCWNYILKILQSLADG